MPMDVSTTRRAQLTRPSGLGAVGWLLPVLMLMPAVLLSAVWSSASSTGSTSRTPVSCAPSSWAPYPLAPAVRRHWPRRPGEQCAHPPPDATALGHRGAPRGRPGREHRLAGARRPDRRRDGACRRPPAGGGAGCARVGGAGRVSAQLARGRSGRRRAGRRAARERASSQRAGDRRAGRARRGGAPVGHVAAGGVPDGGGGAARRRDRGAARGGHPGAALVALPVLLVWSWVARQRAGGRPGLFERAKERGRRAGAVRPVPLPSGRAAGAAGVAPVGSAGWLRTVPLAVVALPAATRSLWPGSLVWAGVLALLVVLSMQWAAGSVAARWLRRALYLVLVLGLSHALLGWPAAPTGDRRVLGALGAVAVGAAILALDRRRALSHQARRRRGARPAVAARPDRLRRRGGGIRRAAARQQRCPRRPRPAAGEGARRGGTAAAAAGGSPGARRTGAGTAFPAAPRRRPRGALPAVLRRRPAAGAVLAPRPRGFRALAAVAERAVRGRAAARLRPDRTGGGHRAAGHRADRAGCLAGPGGRHGLGHRSRAPRSTPRGSSPSCSAAAPACTPRLPDARPAATPRPGLRRGAAGAAERGGRAGHAGTQALGPDAGWGDVAGDAIEGRGEVVALVGLGDRRIVAVAPRRATASTYLALAATVATLLDETGSGNAGGAATTTSTTAREGAEP